MPNIIEFPRATFTECGDGYISELREAPDNVSQPHNRYTKERPKIGGWYTAEKHDNGHTTYRFFTGSGRPEFYVKDYIHSRRIGSLNYAGAGGYHQGIQTSDRTDALLWDKPFNWGEIYDYLDKIMENAQK
tara:strand:- start:2 stop:394 length:393 start_codon:yes stop_codon:yes gene_type:complete